MDDRRDDGTDTGETPPADPIEDRPATDGGPPTADQGDAADALGTSDARGTGDAAEPVGSFESVGPAATEPSPAGSEPALDPDVPQPAPPAPAAPASQWVRPADDAPSQPVVVGWNTGVQWELAERAAPPPPRGKVQIVSVLLRSIDLFLRRPLPFLALALPTTIISALSTGIYQTPGNPAVVFPVVIVTALIGIVFSLAMISAADEIRAGRDAAIGPLIRRGLGRTIVTILSWIAQYLAIFGILIGGSIVVALLVVTRSVPLVVIGFVALMVLLLYILLRWSFATTAIALEPLGPVEAIGRSRAVTRGNVWRIVGLYLLLALLTVPLGIGVGFLAIAATDPIPLVVLSVVAGLVTAPLFSILSTMVFGDLTGRPEVAAPAVPGSTRGIFAAAILVVGVVGLVISVPKVGPAWERLALQGIPVENRGVIVAGTARNPLDPCRPTGIKTTFLSTESIFVGGYFTKPIPAGQIGKVEIFVNGREAGSAPLSDRLRAVACYYELDALIEAAPGTYRLVVSLNGELLAQGEFTVR